MPGEEKMWSVQYKSKNDSQSWSTLNAYKSKESALVHASRALGEYFMIIVTDPDGSVIWSNQLLILDILFNTSSSTQIHN